MEIRNHINFRTEEYFLKELVYGDCVYAWLLLHSHFNPDEKYNYIYKEDINFTKIGAQMHRSRQTVSKRFNDLIENDIIRQYKYNGKTCYKIPYYNEFEELDGETTFQLLCLPLKEQREALIKTYALLLKKKRICEREGKRVFFCSAESLIKECGETASHKTTFDRMRAILTILQGAGIIKFRTLLPRQNEKGEWVGAQMEVYEVSKSASEEWLGIKK